MLTPLPVGKAIIEIVMKPAQVCLQAALPAWVSAVCFVDLFGTE